MLLLWDVSVRFVVRNFLQPAATANLNMILNMKQLHEQNKCVQ